MERLSVPCISERFSSLFRQVFVGLGVALLLAPLSWAQTCVAPPPGMIAWWPLDDTAGTGAADIVGGNSGVRINAPAPSPGMVGGALRFDGATNYVAAPDSDLWAFGANDFTVEFWANWDAPGSGDLVHAGDVFIGSDEGPGGQNKWFFALGGGLLHFTVYNTTQPPPNFYLVRAPFSPTVGQWYHLAVTKRGTLFTIYVDGVALAAEVSAPPIANALAPLVIGRANEPFGGFMNGRLDEITLYSRALSTPELFSISNAGTAGKCKALQVATKALPAAKLSEFLSSPLRATFGQPPLAWMVSGGSLPSGMNLSTEGTLSGTPVQAGEFPITISVTDGIGAVAHRELVQRVVLTSPPPTLQIRKTGTVAVPGRQVEYFVVVENTGEVTARDVTVSEFIEPWFTYLNSNVVPWRVDRGQDLFSVQPPWTETYDEFIKWRIAEVEPGALHVLSYQVQLDAGLPLGRTARGGACTLTTVEAIKREAECGDIIHGCYLYVAPTCLVKPLGCLFILDQCAIGYFRCLAESGIACNIWDALTAGPVDPNQKLVVASRFIRPNQLLVYPIHFENIGTIEARDVFITDVLSSNLDLSTLKLLSPGASLDVATRTVRWNLLNKNLLPGRSDSVLLSVLPTPGLPSGTVIRNKATIQFEVFEPLTTDEVINIIDDVPPHCRLDSMAPVTRTLTFPVSWTGTDAVGEVDNYSIWVSKDRGTFTPLLEATKDSRTTFTGQVGSRYDFLCVAKDTAGNIEIKPAAAEVGTFIETLAGDLNSDGKIDCVDLQIVKASFGKRTGQVGFDVRADTNRDGVVDVRDLAFVSQKLPVGTRCP